MRRPPATRQCHRAPMISALVALTLPAILLMSGASASEAQPTHAAPPTLRVVRTTAAISVTGETAVPRGTGHRPARRPASPANPSNPLAGRHWGVYKGKADQAWGPYLRASGRHRKLLGKIALQPKATWFGKWIPNAGIGRKIRKYIRDTQHGDPQALVQLSLFRMQPWEEEACKQLPSAQQQASYKDWMNRVARAIADTPTAVILQPDGPFALCAPHHSKLPSHLIGYAARVLSAQPHTSVYIDAGADDWLRSDASRAVKILLPAGIRYARGFALNSTHYDSTTHQITFGTKVVAALRRHHVTGKHFVVNTSQNGRPFRGHQYQGSNFDNAATCKTTSERSCVSLGIPPTTNVDSSRWGLGGSVGKQAAAHVDGYLWFGRPWLYMQASPFVMQRALQVARTSPY